MLKIIPAILTDDLKIFQRQLKQMEGAADLIQIDISDGIFTMQKTVGVEEIKTATTDLKYELHLMVAEPSAEIEKWSGLANIQKIIFHYEAAKAPLEINAVIAQIKNRGANAWLALNPETPWPAAEEFIFQADGLLFMSVRPGRQGQKFMPEILEKIKSFKKKHPRALLAVDGGVHQAEMLKLKELGVDYAVAGSEIFNHPNPREHLQELQKLISE